jgi:hypothetical protein
MAAYNRKTSVMKPVRWPKDIYEWLMRQSPRNKDFSAKVVAIMREKKGSV